MRMPSIRWNGVDEVCRMFIVGTVPHLILGDLKKHNFDMDSLLASAQARQTLR